MGSTTEYKVGDRVFAKVTGYPHWPAQVTEVSGEGNNVEYCVAFYGTHEIAYMKPNNLCYYNEENIKRVTSTPGKKKQTKTILSLQQALEECATGVTFLPCNIDNNDEVQENLEQASEVVNQSMSSEDGGLVIDLDAASNVPPVVAPKRGRPSKAEALKNLQAGKRKTRSQRKRSESLSETALAPPTVSPRPDSRNEEPMEDPLKIYSPESEPTEASKVETTEKVETTPVVNGAANGKDESTPVPEAGVTSRSGRKIKPKKFADEISSPFAEQLLTALKASQSPPKKRKASVDSSFENENVAVVQNGTATDSPSSVPKKPKKSLSVDDKDHVLNGEETNSFNGGTGLASAAKRRTVKHRFLSSQGSATSAPPEPENISWKVEAMKPIQEKLLSSCKRIEHLQLEENSNHLLINDSVGDKLAAASVPLAISATVTLPTESSTSVPAISNSIGAISKVICANSTRKSCKSNSLRVSVGTSTDSLQPSPKDTSTKTATIAKSSPLLGKEDKNVNESKELSSGVESDETPKGEAHEGRTPIDSVEQSKPESGDTEQGLLNKVEPVVQDVKVEIEGDKNTRGNKDRSDEINSESEVNGEHESNETEQQAVDKKPKKEYSLEPEVIVPHKLSVEEQSFEVAKAEVQPSTLNLKSEDKIEELDESVQQNKTPSNPRKRVYFNEAIDDQSAENKTKTNVAPTPSADGKKSAGGILRKTLTVETPAGRPHRNVELPSRYKDSVTLTPKLADSKGSGRKPEPPRTKRPRTSETPEHDMEKAEDIVQPTGSQKEPVKMANGKDDVEDETGMDIQLTDEDFLDDEEARQKFKLKLKEKNVMDTVVRLIDASMDENHDLDVALEMLEKLAVAGIVDRSILRKYPDIVQVVRQMQYFVGNQKVVKLTKSQKAELSSKTEKIREQAEKTLECFKEIMSTNPKPLAVLMMEEMQRKSSEALEGSGTT